MTQTDSPNPNLDNEIMATRRRISKPLLLRIGAVGLFVALGTFAVLHSIKKNRDNPGEQDKKLADVQEEESPSDGTSADFENSVTADDDADLNTAGTLLAATQTQPSVTTVSAIDQGTSDQSGGSVLPASSSFNPSTSSSFNPAVPATSPRMNSDTSNSGAFRTGNDTDGMVQRNPNPSTLPTNPSFSDGGFVPVQPASQSDNSVPIITSSQTSQSPFPPLRPGSIDSSPTSELAKDTSSPPVLPVPPAVGRDAMQPDPSNSFSTNDARQGENFSNDSVSPSPPVLPGDGTFSPAARSMTSEMPSGTSTPATTGGFPGNQDNGKITSRTVQTPLAPLRMNQQSSTDAADTDGSFSRSTEASVLDQPGFPPNQPMPSNVDTRPGASDNNQFSSGGAMTPVNRGSPLNSVTQTPVGNRSAAPGQGDRPFADNVSTGTTTLTSQGMRPSTPLSSATGSFGRQPDPVAENSVSAQPTPGERELEGVQLPTLSLQKIAPREIQVNRPATFQLIVKNNGKVPADGVIVHDYVPQGTQLINATPPQTSAQNGQLQWNLGTLQPGQQTTIKMELLPLQPGNIGSVANVTFAAQASAQTVCTKPELAIRHEAPDTVLIGQRVMLEIYVENKGNGAAENVLLQEDVPDGLTFAGGQRELEYEIGTLAPGQTRKVQLMLTASKVGSVKNLLVATGAGKLQATDTVEMRIIAPDLKLTGDGPSRKFLNREAKHVFTISNRGTAPATNMQLVARLPRGLRFVSANNQGQYEPNAHAVVWRLAKLEADRTGRVELTTNPVATGQQNIVVTATADLNQEQSLQQLMDVQQLAELFFDIDDTTDPIEIGANTAYRIKIVNQGAKMAANVRVSVEFPAALRPTRVESNIPNEIRGQTVILQPIPKVDSQQEISFLIHATALSAGDHRVIVNVQNDDREIAVSKEESTHIYADR